jgi:hypothetical protein
MHSVVFGEGQRHQTTKDKMVIPAVLTYCYTHLVTFNVFFPAESSEILDKMTTEYWTECCRDKMTENTGQDGRILDRVTAES